MAIVLLYWIYLLVSTVSIGIGFSTLLRIKNHNPFILPFIGGFVIAILAGTWAIWSNLGANFEIILGILTMVSIAGNRRASITYFFSLKAKITSLPLFSKVLLATLTVFALAQCASAPYIIDNESYYIQTIKWLDSYGFVPGLANLHYFLGQQSGWHIVQSALNLNGITEILNDINGFYLLLGNAYALDKLKSYTTSKQSLFLAVGFLPVFNIFFFQFISSPSPDLPIYLLMVILFSEFASYYLKAKRDLTPILILFMLVVFGVFIKVTAIFLLPLPILLYIKDKTQLKKDLLKISGLAIVAGVIFIVKNSIISGYPLYPIAFFKQDFDWSIPIKIQQYLAKIPMSDALFVTYEQFEQMSMLERIIHWMRLPKLHGLFNKLIMVLLVVFPLTLRSKALKKPFTVLYVITIAQLLLLWLTSPQYRFFFGYIVILSCILAAQFIKKEQLVQLILALSTAVIIVPLFVPFSLRRASDNAFNQELSTFSTDYLLKPHSNSKYKEANFVTLRFGNLEYNTPTNIDFFWATGDGDLPCVQKQQLMSFKNYFELAPQLRTNTLKDGFKSVYFPNE